MLSELKKSLWWPMLFGALEMVCSALLLSCERDMPLVSPFILNNNYYFSSFHYSFLFLHIFFRLEFRVVLTFLLCSKKSIT